MKADRVVFRARVILLTTTVVSDNAFSIVVPLLDQVFGWRPGRIRTLFETNGLALQEWEKARTDRVTITERILVPTEAVA
jgi:hypothetical protein